MAFKPYCSNCNTWHTEAEGHTRESWILASEDDLPTRFTDPRCGDFRCVCSNGFEGGLNLGSAFLHKRSRWPQCFPSPDGDAVCTNVVVRRTEVFTQDEKCP
jgi:hypothetical protein